MSTTRYPVSFWYGSRAQYAAITSKSSNTLYFISDDNTLYRGTVPFARDLHNWLCAATSAPFASIPLALRIVATQPATSAIMSNIISVYQKIPAGL